MSGSKIGGSLSSFGGSSGGGSIAGPSVKAPDVSDPTLILPDTPDTTSRPPDDDLTQVFMLGDGGGTGTSATRPAGSSGTTGSVGTTGSAGTTAGSSGAAAAAPPPPSGTPSWLAAKPNMQGRPVGHFVRVPSPGGISSTPTPLAPGGTHSFLGPVAPGGQPGIVVASSGGGTSTTTSTTTTTPPSTTPSAGGSTSNTASTTANTNPTAAGPVAAAPASTWRPRPGDFHGGAGRELDAAGSFSSSSKDRKRLDKACERKAAEGGDAAAFRPLSAKDRKDFDKTVEDVSAEIARMNYIYKEKLPIKERAYFGPEQEVRMKDMKLLEEDLKDPVKAEVLAMSLRNNKDHALVKYLTPKGYLSYLNQSRKIRAQNKIQDPLNDREQVALYGYTTADYGQINPALRTGQGGMNVLPNDKNDLRPAKERKEGLEAYHDTLNSALKKLDPYDPTGAKPVYRAMNKWPGSDTILVEGKTFVDYGYMSTCAARDKLAPANFKVTLLGVKDGVDISRYSAQPGEAEVLIPAGTKFDITSIKGDEIIMTARY